MTIKILTLQYSGPLVSSISDPVTSDYIFLIDSIQSDLWGLNKWNGTAWNKVNLDQKYYYFVPSTKHPNTGKLYKVDPLEKTIYPITSLNFPTFFDSFSQSFYTYYNCRWYLQSSPSSPCSLCSLCCECPAGPQGDQGPQGEQGPQGDQGPNSVFVNNTVFVDINFGNDTSGVREDECKPVQTLAQALVIALGGDTIYVRPGVYNENGLVLKDNVNFHFQNGASVVTMGDIFVDSVGVNMVITGYGNFTTESGSILNLSNDSNIKIQGNICAVNDGIMFNLNNTTLEVKAGELIGQGSSQIFYLAGNENVKIDADTVVATSQLFYISSTATGNLIFNGKEIFGGENDIAGNGLIKVASDDFNLVVNSQVFNPVTIAAAIQVNVHMVTLSKTRCEFNFQDVVTVGGLLKSTGQSGLLHLQQPRINLNASKIKIDSNVVPALEISCSIVNLVFDIFSYTLDSNEKTFIINDGAIALIKGNAITGPDSTLNPIFLNIQGSTNANIPTIVNLTAQQVFSPGSLLIDQNDNLQVTLDINTATVILPSGVKAIEFTGQNDLTFKTLQIFPGGAAPIGPPLPVIDQLSGTAFLNFDVYQYGIDNSIGIQTRANFFVIKGSLIVADSSNTTLIQAAGATSLQLGNLMAFNGGNALHIESTGSLSVEIDNIYVGGNGIAIQMDGSETSGGQLNGYISSISCNTGKVFYSTSQGNIYLTFDNIESRADTIAFDFPGKGDTWLNGNRINFNDCPLCVKIGAGLEEGDDHLFTLKVSDIYSNNANTVFLINSYGGATLDFQNLHAGNMLDANSAAIHAIRGSVQIIGGNLQVAGFTTLGRALLVEGNTYFTLNLSTVRATGEAVRVKSTNYFLYQANSTQVDDPSPTAANVLTIDCPSFNEITFGGIMRTTGPNTVEVLSSSADVVLKVTSSILISNVGGSSILNSTANPIKAVFAPSSATNPVTLVNVYPAAALMVDSNVN